MTLEQMFVDIRYRHDGRGARDAKRSILDIKDSVDSLKGALDSVGTAFERMTQVMVGTSAAGTFAYRQWSRQIAESSGKAGLSITKFRELYEAESGRIARTAGSDRTTIVESMQRVHSLGANPRQASYLARLGAILQAGNQAHGPTVAEAAKSLERGGFGEAGNIAQQTYAAAQAGAGDVSDYFAAARRAGGIASAANVGIEDMLAILTIGSQGGSISEATTRTMALIKAIARPATGAAGEFFTERTGQDWEHLTNIQRTEGTLAAVQFLDQHFKDSELFKLFTEVEAVNLLKPLMQDMGQAIANRESIANAPTSRPIEAFGRDIANEFFQATKTLGNSMIDFLRAWGKPFAQMITPLLRLMNAGLDALIRLNDFTGGLLAWIPAMLTTLLVLRKLIFGAFLASAARRGWEALSGWAAAQTARARDRVGQAAENVKERSRVAGDAARGFGAGFAGGLAGAGLGAKFASLWMGTRMFFREVMTKARLMHRFGLPNVEHGSTSKFYSRFTLWTARIAFLAMALRGLVGGLGKLLAILAPFVVWSMFRSPASFDPNARFDGPQTQYFAEGKPSGGEPAPGWRDIRRHNRMVAEAEAAQLWSEIGVHFADFRLRIRAMLPNIMIKGIDVLAEGITWYFGMFDMVWTAIGEFIRELLANPGDAIAGGWDAVRAMAARTASGVMGTYLDEHGGRSESAQALADLTAATRAGGVVSPTMLFTKKELEAMGIDGGDFSNVTGAPNFGNIQLPTPPVPLTSSMVQTAPVINLTLGDINIGDTLGEADSRFDLVKDMREAAREELKYAADRIIQEMDGLSP